MIPNLEEMQESFSAMHMYNWDILLQLIHDADIDTYSLQKQI